MNSSLSRAILKFHEKVTGRRILERLEELNRSQWYSRSQLRELQQEKLQRIVEYAYSHVPYYQRVFDQVGFHPNDLRQHPEAFSKLPILTKATIRENWNDLQTTDPEYRKRMSQLSTSGSTGQPLVFMQDANFRDAVTADIQRHIGWAGWKLGELHAFIWGASIKPSLTKKLRTELIDFVWNRFTTNAYFLTDDSMRAFAERIQRQRPKVLFGYASSIHRFAQFVQANPGYQDITFNGVFSSAELLLPSVRQTIEETFRCKMFDRYGTLELGGIACECQAHTGYHISVENNYVEILRDGEVVSPGEVGDIVVTNLNNYGMPFIRYSIGDGGSLYTGGDCPCGREAPKLQSVDGRKVDSFKIRDGRTVWAGFAGSAFRCLAHPSIKQFQVVQKSLDEMIVRLACQGEVPQTVQDEIVQAIRNLFGDTIVVHFEFVDEIPLLSSGKHQYARSELNELKM